VLLSIFRTNQFLLAILLLPYLAVLHLAPIWIQDNWVPVRQGVLAQLLFDLLGYKTPLTRLLAGLLIFIQALLLIRLDFRHKLSSEQTLFTGVFLVLVSSISLPLLHLSAYHFSNLLLLLAVDKLFFIYRKAKATAAILNIGLYLGLAALFTPAYLVYILLAFVGLNLLRGFQFRERVIVLVGVFIVFFLTGVVYFWNGRLAVFVQAQLVDGFALLDFRAGNFFTLLHLALLLLLVLVLVFLRGQIMLRKIMETQQKIAVFYWGMLISLLVVLVQADIQENSLLLLSPFLGLLLGLQWANLRRNVGELIHLLFFILVLLLQYRPFLLP